ncbi:MAG: glycosyltransferase family 2 protein [Chloroflexi bacterium]|nr:glycosyltransferase family 2 protein [Chloroflexota bacterium]
MADDPTPANAPHLSYVVPAYNEAHRLGESLARIVEFSARQPYVVEIIVVDDGSADRTAEIARAAGRDTPEGVSLRVIEHERNRGKGAAVRTGALAANGDFILYLDADLATAPEETAKLLGMLEADADLAIGSRVQPGGFDMRASQPAWRRVGGRLFAMARRRLLLADVDDTQCGFKAFRREAAQAIFSRQRLEGWAFDAELLYLAGKLGFSVRQVPIVWQHMEGSVFRVGIGSSLREVRDLLRIRWLHRGVESER